MGSYIAGPLFTKESSRFGERTDPVTGEGQRFHSGNDFSGAPEGTAVLAAAEGKVVFSGTQASYGNTVIVEHHDSEGNVYYTQYSHLTDKVNRVAVGTQVFAYDALGGVGETGDRSTGVHLHFEVIKPPKGWKFPNNKNGYIWAPRENRVDPDKIRWCVGEEYGGGDRIKGLELTKTSLAITLDEITIRVGFKTDDVTYAKIKSYLAGIENAKIA